MNQGNVTVGIAGLEVVQQLGTTAHQTQQAASAGVVFVVGVDVGTNTLAPKLLMERCSMDVATAGYGSSVYFLCRTIGAFIGAVLLMKIC